MNKKISLVILIIMLFTLSACNTKEERKPISSDSFKLVAEDDDYTVKDVTDTLKNKKGIKEAIVASVKTDYQIEYYVLDDKETAQKMYARNKNRFENVKSSLDKAEVTETDNYSEYKVTSRNRYMLVCKIDNTLIYASVEEKYKDNVTNLIKRLGYIK